MEELTSINRKASFTDIEIDERQNSDKIIKNSNFGEGTEKMVVSAHIRARRPQA